MIILWAIPALRDSSQRSETATRSIRRSRENNSSTEQAFKGVGSQQESAWWTDHQGRMISPGWAGAMVTGSSCVSGGWRNQQLNQRPQHCFASSSDVGNEFEGPQIQRQLLLRDPPVRTQPRPEQRPEAFPGVNRNFTEPIAIVVPGDLPRSMTDRARVVAPFRQPTGDVMFSGVKNSAFGDCLLHQRADRHLWDVLQHPDHHRAGTLEHAEDRWLLLRQCAAAACPLQLATSARSPFF